MGMLSWLFGRTRGMDAETRKSLDEIASDKPLPDILSGERLQHLAETDLDESAIPYLKRACFSQSLLVRESSPLLLHKVYRATKAYDALKALVAAVASPDADMKALQVLVSIGDARSLKLLRSIKPQHEDIVEVIHLIEAKNSGVETLADQTVGSDGGIERMLEYLADTPSDWGEGQWILMRGAPVAYAPILFRLLAANPDRFLPLAEYLVETHVTTVKAFWAQPSIVGALVDCYETGHHSASRLAEEVLLTLASDEFWRPRKPYTREKWLRWVEDPIRYEE